MRTLVKGREIGRGNMVDEDRGEDKEAKTGAKPSPSEAEIAELLHYFEGVASPNARRQVIAKARAASSSEPVAADHFEQTTDRSTQR